MAGGVRPQEIEYKLVDVTNPSDMETNVNNLRNSLGKLQLPDTLKGRFDKLFDKVLGDVTKFKTAMETAGKSKAGLTAMERASTSMKVEWQEIIKLMKQLNASDLKIELDTEAAKELEDLKQKAQELQQEFEKTSNLTSTMGKALKDLSQVSKSKDIENFKNLWKAGDIKGAEEALQRLKNNVKSFTNKENLDAYSRSVQILSDTFYNGKEKAEGLATELQNNVNRQAEILSENSERAQIGLNNMANGAEQAATSANKYGQEAQQAAERTLQMNNELGQIKSRITHFFGLTNAVMLFRRALNNAMTTAKALDKAMTDTAVVTNFSVGDMWQKLPEYTKQANELGATIEGVYKTMTLYYQQGLNTNQAMALGTHTIQMARIAGLEYATATDRMTAALRGFNMQLNETNAQRVADVYSALAANTAANVDEISTAMTKTASLASNAGMEFETTAAFLSQIIETTRESAETAGTALKTVIARFQELKKSPDEIGEVDGEIVDANKIETALRSVGVALRDSVTGEFRALDDVFLELAERWNTLDTNTQRYIATIAAGSRQQSRFIAMMSDYSRTTELVNVANNSAGASTEQFAKTLDSFEAKLNKLKNAWDTFTMGLANSTFVKGIIDILTGILNGLNNITTTSNGTLTSLLKLGAAFALFKIGKSLVAAILPSLTALKTGISDGSTIIGRLGKNFTATFTKIKQLFAGNVAQIKTSTLAFNKYEAASNKYNQTAAIYKKQLDANMVSEKAKAAWDAKIVALEGEKNISAGLYAKTLGLSATQMEAYDAAQAAGLGTSTALALSTGILSEEEKKKFILTQLANGATEEEALGNLESASMTLLKVHADKLHNKEQKKGIIYYIKRIGLMVGEKLGLFGSAAASGVDTGAKIAEGTATGFATVMQKLFNAELWLGVAVILVIIALIVALVAGIIALAKAIKANSIDGKIEALKDQLKDIQEAAKAATDTLSDMASDREAYDEAQQALDELVEGTNEWNEALITANQNVLELLNKYPDLAQYVQNTNGRMTIDSAGWDALIKKQQQVVANTQIAQSRTQTEISELKLQKNTDNLYNKLGMVTAEQADHGLLQQFSLAGQLENKLRDVPILGDIFSFTKGAAFGPLGGILALAQHKTAQEQEQQRQGQLREFSTEMMKRGMSLDSSSKEEIAALYKEVFNTELTDGYYEAMLKNKDALVALGNECLNVSNQLNAYAQSILSTAQTNANLSGDFSGVVGKLIGTGLNGEKVDQQVEAEAKRISQENSTKEIKKQYAEAMGYVYDNGKIYKAGDDGSYTKDDEIKASKDNMVKTLAEQNLSKNLTNAMVEANSQLNRTSYKRTQKDNDSIVRILSGDSKNLTKSDISKVQAAGGFENYLKEIGISDPKALGIDVAAYDETFSTLGNIIETNGKSLSNSVAAMDDTTSQYAKSIEDNTTALQSQNLSEKIKKLSEEYGDEFGKDFINLMGSAGQALSNTDLTESFYSYLSSVDWSDATQFDQMTEQLKVMGEVTAEDEEILEKFAVAAKATAFSVTEIPFEKFREQIKSISGLVEKAAQGVRDYTDEEYQALLDAGADSSQFAATADGYRFLGDTGDLMVEMSNSMNASLQEVDANMHNMLLKAEDSLGDFTEAQEALEAAQAVWVEGREEEMTATETFDQWSHKVIESIKEKFMKIVEGIKAAIAWITKIRKDVSEWFKKIWDGFKKGLLTIWDNILNVFIDLINVFIGLYNKIASKFGRAEIPELERSRKLQGYLDESAIKEAEEKLAEENEQMEEDFKALTDSLEDVAKNVEAAGAQLDPKTLFARIEKNKQDKEEFLQSNKYKKSQTEGYERAGEAADKLIDAFDTYGNAYLKAIQSQALTNEDSTIALRRWQAAVEAGDENADDLYLQLQNTMLQAYNGTALKTIANDFKDFIEVVNKGDSTLEEITRTAERTLAKHFKNFDKITNIFVEDSELLQKALSGDDEALAQFFDKIIYSLSDSRIKSLSDANNTVLTGRDQSWLNELYSSGILTTQVRKATESDIGRIVTTYDPAKDNPVINGSKTISQIGEEYVEIVYKDAFRIKDIVGDISAAAEEAGKEFDKLYNYEQDVLLLERERTELEYKYNQLLRQGNASIKELSNALEALINNMTQTSVALQNLTLLRTKELGEVASASDSGYGKYWYYENGQQRIVESRLKEFVKDEAAMEAFDKASDIMSKIQSNIQKIQQQRDEILQKVDEAKETYLTLQQTVYDAIVHKYQEEIDKLSEINETIENTNSKLFDAVNKAISKQRQDRSNQKTAQELSEKRARLAYLMMDTSGANSQEILQLQKELNNSEESYGDSLIDQKLQELQDQNDIAQQQREDQIELLQNQLDYEQKSGAFWEEANKVLMDAINGNPEEMFSLLSAYEGWDAKSAEQVQKIKDDYISKLATVEWYLGEGWQSELATIDGLLRSIYNAIGNLSSSIYRDDADYVNNKFYSPVTQQYENGSRILTGEERKVDYVARVKEVIPVGEFYNGKKNETGTPISVYGILDLTKNGGEWKAGETYSALDYSGGTAEEKEAKAYDAARKKAASLSGYKTGGLADFTGPAWLDGTKSKPEIVLNAQDSANFIALRDVLSEILHGTSSFTSSNEQAKQQSNGDAYYDIQIQVDSISNDYDVDSLAERLKQDLLDTASYRNVTRASNRR